MSLGITADQLIQEVERLSDQSPDGFSVSEMCETMGRSEDWCRAKIRQLIKAGSVRLNGRARRVRIDGLPCHVPVYVFVGEPGE
jgi:predicted transcriptional regulator